MEKWAIKPSPTDYDPLRHLLLVKGSMADVSTVIKRFGALCGRPKKETTPEGFNFSLPLHGVNTQTMEKLSAALNEMAGLSPAGLALRSLPDPAPSGAPPPLEMLPASEDPFGPPPQPLVPLGAAAPPSSTQGPDIPALPPAPVAAPKPAEDAPVIPQLVPLGGQAEPPKPAAEPVMPADEGGPTPPPHDASLPNFPPASAPAPTPAPAAAELPVIPDLVAKKEEPAAAPAPAPAPIELKPLLEPPIAAPTPAPVAAPAPKTEPPKTAPRTEPAPPIPVRVATDALQTFDTLLVGPYDRFAHAAATSVVSSPGSMYNPLFLYGPPGVGKTHFMHSIARGLGAALGEENVMLTSGPRLSFAVTQALMGARYGTLKDELLKVKALIVDDVHLTAVTEANRAALAEVFARLFASNQQVVFSSLYPARALGGLEEALKISLAKGWAVDLKVPNPLVQIEILQGWLDRQGCQLNTDDTRMFHERLGVAYPDLLRWLRRYVALNKIMTATGAAAKPSDVLNVLFDPGVAATDFPLPTELAAAKNFAPTPPEDGALKLAVVLPKGQEEMAGWITKSFYAAGAKYGVRQTYRHVLLQSYDAGQPFGVPFQIGDACQRAGAQAVLVVGPPNETSLAAKAAEFCHAVVHVLGSLGIACGWVPHRGAMAPAPFLRAHLDFMADAAMPPPPLGAPPR